MRGIAAGLCLLAAVATAHAGGMRLLARQDGAEGDLRPLAPATAPFAAPASASAPANADALLLTAAAQLTSDPIRMPVGEKASIEDALWLTADAANFGLSADWVGGVELLAFAEGGPKVRLRCGPLRPDASVEYLDPAGAWVDTGYDLPAGRRVRLRCVLRPALGRMDLFAREDGAAEELPLALAAECPSLNAAAATRVLRAGGAKFVLRVQRWQLWDLSAAAPVAWTGSALLPRLRVEMTGGTPTGAAFIRRSGGEAYAVLPTYAGFDDGEGFSAADWSQLAASVRAGEPMTLAGVASEGPCPARAFDVPLSDFVFTVRFLVPKTVPAQRRIELVRFVSSPLATPVGPYLSVLPHEGGQDTFRIRCHLAADQQDLWQRDLPTDTWLTLTAQVSPLTRRFTYTVAGAGPEPLAGHDGRTLAFFGDVPFSRARLLYQPLAALRAVPTAPPIEVKVEDFRHDYRTLLKAAGISGYARDMTVAGDRLIRPVAGKVVDTDLAGGDLKIHDLPEAAAASMGIAYDPASGGYWAVCRERSAQTTEIYRLDEHFQVAHRFEGDEIRDSHILNSAYAAGHLDMKAGRLYDLTRRPGLVIADRELHVLDTHAELAALGRNANSGMAVHGDWVFLLAGSRVDIYSLRGRARFAHFQLPTVTVAGRVTSTAGMAADADRLYINYGRGEGLLRVDLKQFGRLGLDEPYLRLAAVSVRLTQPRVDRELLGGPATTQPWTGLGGPAEGAWKLTGETTFTCEPAIGYVGPHAGQVRTLRLSLRRGTPLACLRIAAACGEIPAGRPTFVALVDPAHLAADAPRQAVVTAADLFRRRQHLTSADSLGMPRFEPADLPRDLPGLLVAADPDADVRIDLIDDLKLRPDDLPDRLRVAALLGAAELAGAWLASDTDLAAPRFAGRIDGPVLDLGAGVEALVDADWIAPTLPASRGAARVQVRFAEDRYDLPAAPWQDLARTAAASQPAGRLPARFCQWRVLLDSSDPYVTPVMGELSLQFRHAAEAPPPPPPAAFTLDWRIAVLAAAVLLLACVFVISLRGVLRRRRRAAAPPAR